MPGIGAALKELDKGKQHKVIQMMHARLDKFRQ